MTAYKKLCSQCALAGKKDRRDCPKSWSEEGLASQLKDEAHCWQMRPEPKPDYAAVVELARDRLRSGESPADAIAWLAEQYQALMDDERARVQFERGHIGHQLPGRLDQEGERVGTLNSPVPADLARAASAGVVNAWLNCPTKLARCEACRHPKCARVPTVMDRAPGKQLSFATQRGHLTLIDGGEE